MNLLQQLKKNFNLLPKQTKFTIVLKKFPAKRGKLLQRIRELLSGTEPVGRGFIVNLSNKESKCFTENSCGGGGWVAGG